METAVEKEIENLRRASIADLRRKYQEVFHEQTHGTHRQHLFRRIAWRLQALAEGDLSERARTRAQEIAQDADLRKVAPRGFLAGGGEIIARLPNRSQREPDRRLPPPGALLTRQWKGRTVVVEVLARGFKHENQVYSSLSAVAVAITGTRWNGLAFFGLTRRAPKQRKEGHRAKK
jgi:hypothetical protein